MARHICSKNGLLPTISVGTGTPLTPQVPLTTSGTGVNGVLRPDVTGVPIFPAPARSGYAFNPAAFVVARLASSAMRGATSFTGPLHFSLNGSLGRVFRVKDRYSLELRIDATNAINHVTYAGYIVNVARVIRSSGCLRRQPMRAT